MFVCHKELNGGVFSMLKRSSTLFTLTVKKQQHKRKYRKKERKKRKKRP